MLSIRQQPVTSTTLRHHASVSIAFTVLTVFDIAVVDRGLDRVQPDVSRRPRRGADGSRRRAS